MTKANAKGVVEDRTIGMEMFDDLPPKLRAAINQASMKYSINDVYKLIQDTFEKHTWMDDEMIIDTVISILHKSDNIEEQKMKALYGKKIDIRPN